MVYNRHYSYTVSDFVVVNDVCAFIHIHNIDFFTVVYPMDTINTHMNNKLTDVVVNAPMENLHVILLIMYGFG